MNRKSDAFSLAGRLGSGRFALQGMLELLRTQHNARVHAVATVGVLVAGSAFGVSTDEWCLLVVVITGVWVAEALNTAFEFLCDVASPEFHPLVKSAKDIAAGAVLMSAIGAAAVGVIIFLPRLIALF
ncbi:MAG: diacylglycerol kinase family protein [Halioglobus sp.]